MRDRVATIHGSRRPAGGSIEETCPATVRERLLADSTTGGVLIEREPAARRTDGCTATPTHGAAGPFGAGPPVARGAIRLGPVSRRDLCDGPAPISIGLPLAGDSARTAVGPASLGWIVDGLARPGLDAAAYRPPMRFLGGPDFEDWTFQSEGAVTVAVAYAEAMPSRAWKPVTGVADKEGVSLVIFPGQRQVAPTGHAASDASIACGPRAGQEGRRIDRIPRIVAPLTR